jgi:ribosomal protein S27E
MDKVNTVTKRTRAPLEGKTIYCPNCAKSHHVYHFSWTALYCSGCSQPVAKETFHCNPMPRDNTRFSYSEILLLQRAVNCLIAHTADVLDSSPEADKETSTLLIEELSTLQNRIQSYVYSPHNIIP